MSGSQDRTPGKPLTAGGDAPIKRARLYVTGRVQGVFFRQEAARAARDRGICGWIRNLPDGRVEALLEGPPAAVEELIAWSRHGPPLARVAQIAVEWETPQGEAGFRIEA